MQAREEATMGRMADLVRLIKTMREGGSPGDIGLLKIEIGGVKTPPDIAARLSAAGLEGFLPALSLDELRTLPDGTLGREYARLLDDNGYRPFFISEDLRPRALRHTYMMRYIATHDFIHVVTGFDTGYAGELGVLAATVAQGFAPGGAAQEWAARVLYPLRDFTHRREISHNRRLGHRIGAAAGDLLCFRYEDHLDRPVVDVRRGLSIPPPDAVGLCFPLLVPGTA